MGSRHDQFEDRLQGLEDKVNAVDSKRNLVKQNKSKLSPTVARRHANILRFTKINKKLGDKTKGI